MLEDLLDSASVGGRRAMTDLQKAAEFFDGDDDRGILLEGLVGIAAGLVDAINGVTVPDEPCGPRCNCGSCDETPITADEQMVAWTGPEHGFQPCGHPWTDIDNAVCDGFCTGCAKDDELAMEHYIEATLMECQDCKARYPIVPYYRAAAPHGPDKSCRSTNWKRVPDDKASK